MPNFQNDILKNCSQKLLSKFSFRGAQYPVSPAAMWLPRVNQITILELWPSIQLIHLIKKISGYIFRNEKMLKYEYMLK